MDLSANMINFAFQAYEQSNKTSLVCYKYIIILTHVNRLVWGLHFIECRSAGGGGQGGVQRPLCSINS